MRKFFSIAFIATAALGSAQGWDGDAITVTAGNNYSFKQGMILATARNNLTAPVDVFASPNPFAPETPSTLAGSVFTIGRMDVTNPFSQLDVYYREASLPVGAAEANLQVYQWNGLKWTLKGGTVSTGFNFIRLLGLGTGTYCIMDSTQVVANSNDLLVYTAQKQMNTVSGLSAVTNMNGWFKVDVSNPANPKTTPIAVGFDRPWLCSLDATYTRMYFWKKQPNGFYELYTANVDASHPVRLTNFGNVTDYGFVTSSPNGAKLAFCAKVGGTWNLIAMDSNGGGILNLATNVVPALLNAPTPAHSGTKVAVCGTNTLTIYDAVTGAVSSTSTPPGNPFLGGVNFSSTGGTFILSSTNGLYTGVTVGGALTLGHTATYPSDASPVYSLASTNFAAVPYVDGIDILQMSPKVWTENVFPFGSGAQPRMVIHWR